MWRRGILSKNSAAIQSYRKRLHATHLREHAEIENKSAPACCRRHVMATERHSGCTRPASTLAL
jgi:hypothetical protein